MSQHWRKIVPEKQNQLSDRPRENFDRGYKNLLGIDYGKTLNLSKLYSAAFALIGLFGC